VKQALFLIRQLGLRRFAIILIFWILRRYRRWADPDLHHAISPAKAGEISRDPVLVYQMSKVGSTSLLYSLQFAYAKAGLFRVPMYHAHTLSNLDFHEQQAEQAKGPGHHLALVREYKQIRRAIEDQPLAHWNVVSLVRDPVARQVSDYFHHIDRHLPDWRSRWENQKLSIDEVVQNFLTVHDPTYNWFEAEIDSIFGIDVYASAFPHEAGYGIYLRPPKGSLLVLRLEDLDRVAKPAVDQLLGIKKFKLYSFNLGGEAGYGEIYRQFKRQPIPNWYLEKIYSGRIARHFYTSAELEKFTRKWGGGDRSAQ
jgi:Putative capsular polysaccharide synthesis protein